MDQQIVLPPPVSPSDIAVMNNNIGYIQRDIGEIKQSIKELAGVYATQVFVLDSNKATDLRLKKLEETGSLYKWLSPTFSAILAAVLTFFVVQYFTMLK